MDFVEDNPVQCRFELAIDESHEVAAAYYRHEGDRLILTHTIVPERFTGHGIGSALAAGVFDLLRASRRHAVLRCPFMVAFHARHPEYADFIPNELEPGASS